MLKVLISILFSLIIFLSEGICKNVEKNIFITGGNRGIGMALVKNYLNQGYMVYTTYQNIQKSSELLDNKNPNLKTLQVNFLDSNALEKITKFLREIPLDIVINNASLFPYNVLTIDKIDADEWQKAFYVNTIFPTLLANKLKKNIISGLDKKLVFISSRRGSNAINTCDEYKGRYGYRSTKAALNSCAVAISQDFSDEGISVLVLHPGRVATEITAFSGSTPEVAAQNIVRQINLSSMQNTGQFISAESGEILPW